MKCIILLFLHLTHSQKNMEIKTGGIYTESGICFIIIVPFMHQTIGLIFMMLRMKGSLEAGGIKVDEPGCHGTVNYPVLLEESISRYA